MTQDLLVALALVLVLEGILPFLHPQGWRRTMHQVAEFDDSTLRVVGALSMLVGLILLYVVR